MSENIFYKRSGTTDKGKYYENLVIADICLSLATDSNVKNFRISSNDRDFGDFDDIVVDVETNNKWELFAIQLKHFNNKEKCLSLNSLKAESGNFSLKKYFKSYKTINYKTAKFVLLTNQKFDVDKNTKIEIAEKDKQFSLQIVNYDTNAFLNRGKSYRFRIVDHNIPEMDEYKNFFSDFLLYTNQPNIETRKTNFLVHFKKNFSCYGAECDAFLNFISKWSILEGKKEKLDKNLILQKIALIILNPFIKPILSDCINAKTKLLQEVINNFQITVIRKESENIVRKMWGDVKTRMSFEDKDVINIIRKYQLSMFRETGDDLAEAGLTKLLWLLEKSPLIISEHDRIYKAINLCPHNKFVIIKENEELIETLNNFSIFKNLSDLRLKPSLYDTIVKNFRCSIQGKKEISLEILIEKIPNFTTILTTDELVKMLDGPLLIGEKMELVPQPYINREISRNFIDIRYFNYIDKDTLIVLDCMQKEYKIASKLGNFNLILVTKYLKEENKKTEYIRKNIVDKIPLYHTSPDIKKYVFGLDLYREETMCSADDFNEICKRNNNFTRYHHLRIINENILEWITSKGDTSDLEAFRIHNEFMNETELYEKELETNINLITCDPGMGKSELLKSLKNNSPIWLYAIFFCSSDITLLCEKLNTCKKNQEEVLIDFVLETKYFNYPNFQKEAIKMFIENGQAVFFWDALDEITSKNIEIIINLIEKVSSKSVYQWISSRCHLKNFLEKNFNTLSRNIRQFNDEEQTFYIHKRLDGLYSKQIIEDILSIIRSTVKLIKHNDVLGIPLQIYMLTELFRQDHKKYLELLKEAFSLTDLYQHIVDEKFNRYYREKAYIDSPNEALKQVLDVHKQSMFERYEKAGMKALIKEELFERLNIKCDDFLKQIETKSDSIGLITEVTDNFPQFLHNSYAEFFVAKYFVEHYKEINNLDAIIHDSTYANIRFFFDLMSAKNSSAHIAVLYNNIDLLKTNQNGLNDCKDMRGRNVLDLACTWSQKWIVFDVQYINGEYIIDNKSDVFQAENAEYKEILNYILQHCEIEEDPLVYVDKVDCLLPKLLILIKQNKKITKDFYSQEMINILYYATKFNHHQFIDLLDRVPFVRTEKDNGSLLHLAATYNYEEFLRKLLSAEDYRNSVNNKDKFGQTALHRACQHGFYRIAKCLIDYGADSNAECNKKLTPLHIACLHAHEEIVILLLKSGAKANSCKDYNITPLHQACWNGQTEVARTLIHNGAFINARADDGCTPLYVASRNKHQKIVKLLLESKADVNGAQNEGVTPLFIACQEGHEENVKLLLESGANVNQTTHTGESPLYIACQNGHKSIVQMLIKYDAFKSVNAKFIEMVRQQNNSDIIELLKEANPEKCSF